MKQIECPDCGRHVRPCNLARHRRSRHLPRPRTRTQWTKWTSPNIPMRLGRERDRRYDEHVPRGEGPHRFRIYRLRGGELELVASAPDAECMGLAVYTCAQEGEFIVDDAVGVLDTGPEPGAWVANPFALGRRKP